MKYLLYLRYFFYISVNWNFRLAWFTVSHEIRGEKKYGINTTRINDLKKLSVTGGNLKNAEMYQGANYYLLENLFDNLRTLKAGNNFIDVGCGKGRALVVAAHFGFSDLTGIDFAEQLCEEARKNTGHLKQLFPNTRVKIICMDAVNYEFEKDTDVFFFFNPFNEIVMKAVLKNIIRSVQADRKIYVVYINPVHKELFLNEGFSEIFSVKKLRLIEGVILCHHLNTTVNKFSQRIPF